MTDDPRIEAAARALAKWMSEATEGLCRQMAVSAIEAADRAAWNSGKPRSGSRRLVWVPSTPPDDGFVNIGCWDGKTWRFGHGGREFARQPTHFQPLPSPPESEPSE